MSNGIDGVPKRSVLTPDGDVLWGSSTEAAVDTFEVSGQPMPRRFIAALAAVKRAAAETNRDLGLLDANKAAAIAAAAQEIVDGLHGNQFPVDVYQTGSGTSSNMNVNEVIAAICARQSPPVFVHPRDDVNMGQSSNDVVPTAMHICTAVALQELLRPALIELRDALAAKSAEFWPVIKLARTHLQDAAPIRLGQEFLGYQGQVENCLTLVDRAMDTLLAVSLGGTAVGTGINTDPRFAQKCCDLLAQRYGIAFQEIPNHFAGQSTLDRLISAHSDIKTSALSLWKIGSDIRLLGSGPRAGFGELVLPDSHVQSSIMPGKRPPAIIESLTMVVARVLGNDLTITFSQTGSILELNVMMPVTIAAAMESIELLASATRNLSRHCIEGLQATDQGSVNLERGLMLATALTPLIGYDAAAKLVDEASETGETIRQVAARRGLSDEEISRAMDFPALTAPQLARPAVVRPMRVPEGSEPS